MRPLALQRGDLLPERQILQGELGLVGEQGAHQADQHLHELHQHSSGHRLLLRREEEYSQQKASSTVKGDCYQSSCHANQVLAGRRRMG
jgi:hypothetical protein